MDSPGRNLSMLFFPLMAQGHMLPMLDMARLFAAHGVKSTVITTPGNAPAVDSYIDRAGADSTLQPIRLQLIPFPPDTGLPEGCENLSSVTAPQDFPTFFAALSMLREPFREVVGAHLPDCIVTDMFLPWTYDVAAEFNIPRLVFHGTSFFSLCVTHSVERYRILEKLPEDSESLVIPGLPHRVELLKSQLPVSDETMAELFGQMTESESKSYGVVVNSFLELEPDYARHYREIVGRRAWHVGPLALCGNKAAVDRADCLRWLDGKSPGSVVYVCFGSMSDFSAVQLREMALGLEDSGHRFVWVVRRGGNEWVPEGFEERIEGRGLIIRGWAPQILIVNHRSVGGFVTHCGWNSTLEGVSAGLPLVAWPLFAEQFYNERLIVDVLKIGVSVGVKKYCMKFEEREVVEAEAIKKAVDEVMEGGEEGQRRRTRARELGEKARRAVEEGGSSYNDMRNLIQEIKNKKKAIEAQPIDISNGGGDVM